MLKIKNYLKSLKSKAGKIMPQRYLNLFKGEWKEDDRHAFNVDQRLVASFFDETQSLVFSEESAKKEEAALLPFVDVSAESKVLDLGCGNGRWGEILIPKCIKYVGVDISKSFVEKAKQKNLYNQNAHFYCLPVQQYIEAEAYDLILLIGLITYMNDENITQMVSN